MMPRTAETVPAIRINTPQETSGVKTSNRKRTRPYTATLSITPDIRAEIGDGLAGCAYGSHLWNGMIPALMENPVKRAKNAMVTRGTDEVARCRNANELVITKRMMIPSRTNRDDNWVMIK